MNLDPVEFQAVYWAFRAGSREAACHLFGLCQPHILHAIRKRWDQRLQAVYSVEDVAQEVWCGFLARPLLQRSFALPGELIRFLEVMVGFRLIDLKRQQLSCQRHNLGRECSLGCLRPAEADCLADSKPAPVEAVTDCDQWQTVLARLRPREQDALELLRQGYDEEEVAVILGIGERTVRRIVDRARAEAAC